jgi:hypothetical protein
VTRWLGPVAAAAVIGVTVACATNTATREGRIPGEREDCQAAAALVSSGKATTQTFATLGWCDESGPPALAGVWRALPQDTIRVRAFLGASANVRDGRIYSAAFSAACDSARRPRARAAALLVLVAQLDSGATVTVVASSRSEVWRAQLARESHASQLRGTEPLPSDARTRVSALIRTLAAGRPTGAAGLRDPLGVAVQAARLDLERLRP